MNLDYRYGTGNVFSSLVEETFEARTKARTLVFLLTPNNENDKRLFIF